MLTPQWLCRVPPGLSRGLMLGLLPALAALSVVLPWFANSDAVNWRGDFAQYAARHEHFRQAVLEHGEFPERSHLLGGGYPIIGDPEDPSMSPLVLLTVICGTLTGLKLIVLVCMLASALGTTILLRCVLHTRAPPAVFAGMLAALVPWIPYHFTDGNPNEALVGFVPLALAFFGLSLQRRAWVIALAAVLYVVLADGKQIFVVLVALLGLVALLRALPLSLATKATTSSAYGAPRGLMLRRLSQALALAFIVALPRLVPAFELIADSGGLAHMKLHFHAPQYSTSTIHAFTPSRLAGDLAMLRAAKAGDLASAGLGIVPLLLIAAAALWRLRRACGLLFIALLAAWLAMAHRAPLDLFAPLWKLPLFNAVDAPDKYFGGPMLLLLIIVAGLGADALWARLVPCGGAWRRCAITLCVLAALFSVAQLWLHTRAIAADAFSKPLPAVAVEQVPFQQVKSAGLWRGRFEPLASNTYVNVLRGVGTIDWYTGIPLAENAIAKDIVQADGAVQRNPLWRGEAWFVDGGTVLQTDISYQHMEVRCDGRGGLLVLNQNFHKDWRVEGLVTEDHAGLLSVRVPPGTATIRFEYASSALRIGLALCCVGFILLGVLLVQQRRDGAVGNLARAVLR